LVGVGGMHGDHAAPDGAAFLRHAQSLPDPTIAELLANREPLTGVTTIQFPTSRRRHFERLRRRPAGYLALGDAICSFNPVYGQGMACAAMQALALGAALDRHGEASAAMAAEYYKTAATLISTPWRFAVGADFAYPDTRGPRPVGIKLLNWYSQQIQLAAQTSPKVRRAFTSVQQLVAPPGLLWKPSMILDVLRSARDPNSQRSRHPAPESAP
jgi:2-polyprenyl-6-methoxyphenol hydroxylase-like FAD-dependent oxidoreductase